MKHINLECEVPADNLLEVIKKTLWFLLWTQCFMGDWVAQSLKQFQNWQPILEH